MSNLRLILSDLCFSPVTEKPNFVKTGIAMKRINLLISLVFILCFTTFTTLKADEGKYMLMLMALCEKWRTMRKSLTLV